MARKFHPDVSKEQNAEARFKEINESYQVLNDKDKRQAYDQLGPQWEQGQNFTPPPGKEPNFQSGFNPEDMGKYSDFFAEMFGGQPGKNQYEQRNFRMRGQDLNATIEISLGEAFNGATRTLNLQVQDIDKDGRMQQRPRQLKVKIPKGVRESQQIRLSGQGGSGVGGGKDGDLFLQVAFALHPLFQADRRDIHLKLPITPWEAALGAHINVPTLGGDIELKIPANSQNGHKLRLKGRGLPGNPSGDQFVILHLETPPADSDTARDLYQRMADEIPFNPRKARGI